MPRPPRRLGLLDAMILVAAVALGSAWITHRRPEKPTWLSDRDEPDRVVVGIFPARPFFLGIEWAYLAIQWVYPVCVTVGFGLIAIGVRQAWPRPRRAFLSPGVAACTAIAIRMAIILITELASSLSRGHTDDWRHMWGEFRHIIVDLITSTGPIVFGDGVIYVWSILALSGRMRCERSAVDRLGRALGCFWILAMLIDYVIWEIT